MVFNRHCLRRLNPAGTSALLRWTKRSYGRVCRTGDLYQVKADWPHQDTRGHTYASGEIILGQAPGLSLFCQLQNLVDVGYFIPSILPNGA